MISGGAALRWVIGCVVVGVLLAGLLMPVAGGIGRTLEQAADATGHVAVDVSSGVVPAATTITDAAGVPIARVFEQYRIPAAATEISPWMNAAIVAIEDRRFYSHDGLDWPGTARALIENLAANGDALQGQGASTITMQYVKNYRLYVLADTDAERAAAVADTVARKLTEVRAARRLEGRLPKQEILRRYLNLVYFGNGAYGVTAAARTYFDTTAAALTIPQAALLAGLVRAPATLDPVEHPAAALARRNLVLAAMADVGSLTPATAAAAQARPLSIEHPLVAVRNGCADARPGTGSFCRYTLDYLESAGLPRAQLRTGGYVIRTTLDPRAGQVAKQAVADQVPPGQNTGTIMSGGMWCPPDPIASITDRHGQPVPLDEQPCQRAISEYLAARLAVTLSHDTIPAHT